MSKSNAFTPSLDGWYAVVASPGGHGIRYLSRGAKSPELFEAHGDHVSRFPAFWPRAEAERVANLHMADNQSTQGPWTVVPLCELAFQLSLDYPHPLSAYEARLLTAMPLDARRAYALALDSFQGGELQLLCPVEWTQACSGCYEGYHLLESAGHGCVECGGSGRRRHAQWSAYLGNEH